MVVWVLDRHRTRRKAPTPPPPMWRSSSKGSRRSSSGLVRRPPPRAIVGVVGVVGVSNPVRRRLKTIGTDGSRRSLKRRERCCCPQHGRCVPSRPVPFLSFRSVDLWGGFSWVSLCAWISRACVRVCGVIVIGYRSLCWLRSPTTRPNTDTKPRMHTITKHPRARPPQIPEWIDRLSVDSIIRYDSTHHPCIDPSIDPPERTPQTQAPERAATTPTTTRRGKNTTQEAARGRGVIKWRPASSTSWQPASRS